MVRRIARFRWVLGGLLALMGIGMAAAAGASVEKSGPSRPNVLFIAVDDLNDWVGALRGYPGVQTPNLDRLAQRGVLFTRAYASAPACNPSRASLLSGRLPSTTGVYLNEQPWRPAMPDVVTLPDQFRRNGYFVAGGGKIFHGHMNDERAWDEYRPTPPTPSPSGRPLNGIRNTAHFDWGPVELPDEAMGDWKIASWAADFLERDQQKPFFLAVGLFRPHLPWYVPRKYFDQYPLASVKRPSVKADDLDDLPRAGRRMAAPDGDHKKVTETDNWERAIQGYLASISFADACVGQVLDALERSPHRDNTIVVLWGDHGWHLGEKQHWRKFTLWEEATRVPLMISAPGVTLAGTRSPRTVSLLDLYPTLTELCGIPAPAGLDGRSLLPLLRSPQAPWDRPVLSTHGRKNHAVRSERWRYIRYADGSEELYDHQNDPQEWRNLANDPALEGVKQDLARRLPRVNAPNAPFGDDGGDD